MGEERYRCEPRAERRATVPVDARAFDGCISRDDGRTSRGDSVWRAQVWDKTARPRRAHQPIDDECGATRASSVGQWQGVDHPSSVSVGHPRAASEKTCRRLNGKLGSSLRPDACLGCISTPKTTQTDTIMIDASQEVLRRTIRRNDKRPRRRRSDDDGDDGEDGEDSGPLTTPLGIGGTSGPTKSCAGCKAPLRETSRHGRSVVWRSRGLGRGGCFYRTRQESRPQVAREDGDAHRVTGCSQEGSLILVSTSCSSCGQSFGPWP